MKLVEFVTTHSHRNEITIRDRARKSLHGTSNCSHMKLVEFVTAHCHRNKIAIRGRAMKSLCVATNFSYISLHEIYLNMNLQNVFNRFIIFKHIEALLRQCHWKMLCALAYCGGFITPYMPSFFQHSWLYTAHKKLRIFDFEWKFFKVSKNVCKLFKSS